MKKFDSRLRNENLIATLIIVSVFLITAVLSIWVYSMS
jgi:hypothetical protein